MRIGVFCSGGDAPGMNACVRAVVRSAVSAGHEVIGIRRGFQGILDEDFHRGPDGTATMNLRSVSGILRFGGTVLQTSRCPDFLTTEGRQRAAGLLGKHGIDSLIAIGGDGTFRGCVALAELWRGRIVGCPGTIDNDLIGSDFTIGFHTAVATAVDAVDKLRDTADSHQRLFLVEVMGRHSGYIAIYTALNAAAEIACIPETGFDVAAVRHQIDVLKQRGKHSLMIIVAEGVTPKGAMHVMEQLGKLGCPFSMRAVVLGHLQRGGSPVPPDRLLGMRLGDFAVRSLLDGHSGMMAGEIGGKLTLTPFAETYARHKPIPQDLLSLLATMAQ